ncbi:HpcH/HpaI aldolase family protein [Gimesia aquarii]|uniref:2-keto-3-deoxy-L-rhamnonate aldolase n=1 Tax=Gimesia aquarii TaxID=2527964 RepID=A0A517VWY5_9PLAN|nr:aldolase/citrate lyase family protein [Gimesia aquarii]QDT97515.1 2-keto-3-deoxy-L-rhamnonate aldolase [Gimesia aquarii]
MRLSRVKAKLNRGEPVLITCCHFTDPSVYELVSLMGFDGIWLDVEHHSTSGETAASLMRAARVGTSDIIARPAKGEFMRMGRLLEAGAQGIMYPRCESAEEALELVRWAKFAPEGERGVDGANGDNPYCCMPMPEYLKTANDHTLLIAQLESPNALEQAEAIANVPGIDVLMLGPGDLSVIAGIPYQFDHPLITDAYRRVSEAAKNTGKWWGTVSSTPKHTQMLFDMGAKFICHGCDLIMVKQGMERIQERYASLGFTFDNRLISEAEELKSQS